MKTLKKLSLVLTALFLLVACGGGSPEAVVEKYFKAAQNVDFKSAKECLAKDIAAMFDEEIGELDEDDIKELKEKNADIKVKIIRSVVDGETAIVYFEETHGDHSHEKSLPLVKEDGKWKISILY